MTERVFPCVELGYDRATGNSVQGNVPACHMNCPGHPDSALAKVLPCAQRREKVGPGTHPDCNATLGITSTTARIVGP